MFSALEIKTEKFNLYSLVHQFYFNKTRIREKKVKGEKLKKYLKINLFKNSNFNESVVY